MEAAFSVYRKIESSPDVAVHGQVTTKPHIVINPFHDGTQRLIDLGRFPKARDYFERHRRRLLSRNVAQRDTTRWYRTIDRVYPDLRRRPKLLIPDIKADNLIVLEAGKLYPHHNLYYVASDYWDLRALRTILRSSLGRFFVWMYGVKMRGDFLRFQAQYLRRICVPNLMSVPKRLTQRLVAVDASSDQDEAKSRGQPIEPEHRRVAEGLLNAIRKVAIGILHGLNRDQDLRLTVDWPANVELLRPVRPEPHHARADVRSIYPKRRSELLAPKFLEDAYVSGIGRAQVPVFDRCLELTTLAKVKRLHRFEVSMPISGARRTQVGLTRNERSRHGEGSEMSKVSQPLTGIGI